MDHHHPLARHLTLLRDLLHQTKGIKQNKQHEIEQLASDLNGLCEQIETLEEMIRMTEKFLLIDNNK